MFRIPTIQDHWRYTYGRGVDSVFRHCLIHEEAENVLNDCHFGACGGHMSGYATTQKILHAGYF